MLWACVRVYIQTDFKIKILMGSMLRNKLGTFLPKLFLLCLLRVGTRILITIVILGSAVQIYLCNLFGTLVTAVVFSDHQRLPEHTRPTLESENCV